MKRTYLLKDDEIITVVRALCEVMIRIEDEETELYNDLWEWHDKMGDIILEITGRETLEGFEVGELY